MDPISNKKDFEDLTIKLRDLAYSYIEKYNPSRQQTKTFLLKKYLTKFQGSKSRKEVSEIIDKIVLIWSLSVTVITKSDLFNFISSYKV